jgi:hypothetical protein
MIVNYFLGLKPDKTDLQSDFTLAQTNLLILQSFNLLIKKIRNKLLYLHVTFFDYEYKTDFKYRKINY